MSTRSCFSSLSVCRPSHSVHRSLKDALSCYITGSYQHVLEIITANNRRSGGQMSNDLCAGSPTGVRAVERDLVFPVDVYILNVQIGHKKGISAKHWYVTSF